ncbi:spexin prohormone 2 [Pangasianodon hypophthalmus]|uniref:spexin prohormone 2 n=1 Tax=Pangasianodon hypophthalmus TaxID=310915 RepID=UPI000EFFBF37|nr:spexin prohormone 2 [Pangasianodon hypophthalmus]
MEEENDFPGPEYSCREDLTGSSVVPLTSYTYTPFSIEIPNNYNNVSHPSSHPHQHRPTPRDTSEDERACPSVWDDDFNTHGFSCPLCCDPSSSRLSQCPPVCYSDGLLPPYQFPNHTTASHTWTPGGAVQYHTSSVQPTFCPVAPDMETVGQHKDSMRSFSEKSKKPCHCTKSQCLKLYCDCFANGEICSDCSCINCCNNMEHATDRYRAIKTCLDRNPDAFRSKINSSVQGDVKGSHTRGCNCKSSGCLKNYCECYKAKIMCSSVCKCVSCSNYSRSEVKESAVETSSHSDYSSTQAKSSVSCITDAVVEATCGCLLAQAEEAEKEGLTRVQAERATLEEFGHCLTQIVHFMFKHTHTQR